MESPATSPFNMTRPEVTKSRIRQEIWNYLEVKNLARFPRPVHHRIPNFEGAAAASEKLSTFEAFRNAHTVKVSPDKPQEHARFLTLQAGKSLLVPTPRMRSGLFNRIVPPHRCGKDKLRVCATSQGVKEYSVPVGLDAKVKIDLIIVGSVAVSTKGYRIGKGEGFADLEYAIMNTMGALTQNTVVVSTVHDCQVVDIPDHIISQHDLVVDYILTPTRIIKCKGGQPRFPTGIVWSELSTEKIAQIPVLRTLREAERKAGRDVRLKDGEEPETTANWKDINECGRSAQENSPQPHRVHSRRKLPRVQDGHLTSHKQANQSLNCYR